MSAFSQNASVLLKRIFSLKEESSFILCTDTMAQTSEYLISEFAYNIKGSDNAVIYVSFEHFNRPVYAKNYIDASSMSIKQIMSTVTSQLPKSDNVQKKSLVVIDSINYIPIEVICEFVKYLVSRYVTVVAIYHMCMPTQRVESLQHYPNTVQLLKFIATTVFEISAYRTADDGGDLDLELNRFVIPRNLNSSVYIVNLVNKRKSGRALSYKILINSETHEYRLIEDNNENQETESNAEALSLLTTFNLGTTEKQKQIKEQVELPYLEAQKFNTGGAIVYEFEKDDDHDEEDPYEDPF